MKTPHFRAVFSALHLSSTHFGGDYWTRTSDLLRVKEFAENSLKPMRRSWLRVLIFRILQHFLQMVARIRRNLPDEATVYDTTAL